MQFLILIVDMAAVSLVNLHSYGVCSNPTATKSDSWLTPNRR